MRAKPQYGGCMVIAKWGQKLGGKGFHDRDSTAMKAKRKCQDLKGR